MAAYSKAKIKGFFTRSDAAKTTAAKGKELEDLACYLFEKLPGLEISRRNVKNKFANEEIDVAFFNEQVTGGLKFRNYLILVECKNWSKPVGSEEVAWFAWKIESRHLDFGILIAAKGVTGDADDGKEAHDVVSKALAKGIQLIVITRAEILSAKTSQELVKLIKVKLCDLVVMGTIWP